MTERQPTSPATIDPSATRPAKRTWPLFLGVLAIVGALAGVEMYAVVTRGHADRPPSAVVASAPATQSQIIGDVDTPRVDSLRGPQIALAGWALDGAGIRSVEIRIAGQALPARYGLARPDVAQARPGYPDSARAGFEFAANLTSLPAPPGVDRRPLQVVAIARDGRERVLATRDIIEAAALSRFTDMSGRSYSGQPFYVLPAL